MALPSSPNAGKMSDMILPKWWPLLLLLACCGISCASGKRIPPEQVFRGTCLLDFEQSDFTPEGDDPLRRWWLTGDVGEIASRIGVGNPASVTIRGRLSEPGHYGHMSAYERQLEVTEVLEVRPVEVEDVEDQR